MKLTVLIEGKETTVSLLRSIAVGSNVKLILKSAAILWDYSNISDKLRNNVIEIGGTTVTLPDGYYTINNIIDVLKGEKATVSFSETTLKSEIQSTKELRLGKFGLLLEHRENQTIPANSQIRSKRAVDVNGGLRLVKISCNAVNTEENIWMDGRRSQVFSTLPITTDGSLKGSITRYTDIESKVSASQGTYQQLVFTARPRM